MHALQAEIDGEHISVELHVTGDGLIVDVIRKVVWDLGGFFGQVFGEVGKALVLASVFFERRCHVVEITAEML